MKFCDCILNACNAFIIKKKPSQNTQNHSRFLYFSVTDAQRQTNGLNNIMTLAVLYILISVLLWSVCFWKNDKATKQLLQVII